MEGNNPTGSLVLFQYASINQELKKTYNIHHRSNDPLKPMVEAMIKKAHLCLQEALSSDVLHMATVLHPFLRTSWVNKVGLGEEIVEKEKKLLCKIFELRAKEMENDLVEITAPAEPVVEPSDGDGGFNLWNCLEAPEPTSTSQEITKYLEGNKKSIEGYKHSPNVALIWWKVRDFMISFYSLKIICLMFYFDIK